MKYSLEKNNSKKLIIGMSILFCAIILVIGGSLAFFTQNASEATGNIVSSNSDDAYINYSDDKSGMLNNLIPLKTENINNAISNSCVDSNGYNVCSLYMFTLESTYGEFQKINISMTPTGNSFTNLKYMFGKLDENLTPTFITEEPVALEKNNLNSINLLENETLYTDTPSTYAILFYIESKDYDQTGEDAGKSFGATIRIDSLTTGRYIIESFGEECWHTEPLGDGTYMITEFYGIDNTYLYNEETQEYYRGPNYGNIKEVCKDIYVTQDDTTGYYSIIVPSSVGSKPVSTLGATLFLGADLNAYDINNYAYVERIDIGYGITTLADGIMESNFVAGAFTGVGADPFKQQVVVDELVINLPRSLKKIGDAVFSQTALNSITIPYSVESIGVLAFNNSFQLTEVVFEDLEEHPSQLWKINDSAFAKTDLNYPLGSPLYIPSSVTYFGDEVFSRTKIEEIKYSGTADYYGNNWAGGATVIP